MTRIELGWFDGPGDTPAYDPGDSAGCPVCGGPLVFGSGAVVTNSILVPPSPIGTAMDARLAMAAAQRSYFYRLHRDCRSSLSPKEAVALDASLLPTLHCGPNHIEFVTLQGGPAALSQRNADCAPPGALRSDR